MQNQLTVFAGSASHALGSAVCEHLQTGPALHECRRFPDGEIQIEIHESVRGHDVYLLQATSPPVNDHLVELLLLADACRRAGAARLTALIPYFGYARQDCRADGRSLGARVAANFVETGGFDRLVLVDAHTPAIEGFFDAPLDHLTAVPELAKAAAPAISASAVVVAPDLGAVKLARAYASQLHLPMAVIHKTRLNGESVEAHAVIGQVRGQLPLIVDDMLSTGATIEAAVAALRSAGATEPMNVAVTHALLVGRAREILDRLPVARLFVTDTVAIESSNWGQLEVCSIAPLLATAIRRTHDDQFQSSERAG